MKKNKDKNEDKKAKNKILKIAGQSLGIMAIGLMLNGILPPPASAVSAQELDRARREMLDRMDDESRDAYSEVQHQAEEDGVLENAFDTVIEAFTGS